MKDNANKSVGLADLGAVFGQVDAEVNGLENATVEAVEFPTPEETVKPQPKKAVKVQPVEKEAPIATDNSKEIAELTRVVKGLVEIAAANRPNGTTPNQQYSLMSNPKTEATKIIESGTQKFMRTAVVNTKRQFLKSPHTLLYIPLNSPLIPRNKGNYSADKKLSQWTCTINLMEYKVPAGKQVLVPVRIFEQFTLASLSKVSGEAGWIDFNKAKQAMGNDDFYTQQNLQLFDFTGQPWETSYINPNSKYYDEEKANAFIESKIGK